MTQTEQGADEIVAHEAAIVAELFARYADGGVAIGELARWLSGLGVATRTGKPRWDRSTVWGMLRNPAYAGRACFGKTMRTDRSPGSTAPPAWPGAPPPPLLADRDRKRLRDTGALDGRRPLAAGSGDWPP